MKWYGVCVCVCVCVCVVVVVDVLGVLIICCCCFVVVVCFFVVFFGGWAELFTCSYPLKVQARLPRDHRMATQSRVSGGVTFCV